MTLDQYLSTNPKLNGSDKLVAPVERQERILEDALFTTKDDFYKPIIKNLARLSKSINEQKEKFQ